MINVKRSVVLLSLCLAQTSIAHADDLKNVLNTQYKNQVLALRYPFKKGDQKFDSGGHPLNMAAEGSWTVHGGILVSKLSLASDVLRLEGPRVGFGSDQKDGKGIVVPLGKSVKVEIHLDHPLASADEAQVILDRVFFLDREESLRHAKPEYRRLGESSANESVASMGTEKDGFVAPTTKYTPEPDYADEARRAKYQGTVGLSVVVDKAGNVSRIKIERALGLGLDEKAVDTVKRWRFQPATQNGQPVAVQTYLEISFNLY